MYSNKLKLMVEASKLYYIHGLTQEEISKQLFISRPQVSRLLSDAKEEKIVSISVNDPFSEEYRISNIIKEKFNLSHVLVVNPSNGNAFKELSEEVSRILSSKVGNGDYIGVSPGKTLSSSSEFINIHNVKDIKFIPLLGGATFEGVDWHANNNCQRLAGRMKASHMVLNAPLIIREDYLRKELMNNPAIKPVFDAYENLNVILMGIGQTTTDSSLSQIGISDEEILNAHENGAKAIVAGSFLNSDGKEVLKDQSDIFLGAKLKHLKKCPCVIAISEGINKLEAIESSLKGGVIDIFCTTLQTAKGILTLK